MFPLLLLAIFLSLTMVNSQPSGYVSRNTELPELGDAFRLHYLYSEPSANQTVKGTFLLIHGFPYTSYHYRHVMGPLAEAGYRVIAPDYRGAGKSSKPTGWSPDYRKTVIAGDLFHLIHSVLNITEKIHVVGHDIGGMVAHAYATTYANHTASVAWGECPLPGTTEYEERKTMLNHFHLLFHSVPDLPEALIAGKEEVYLRYFFDRQAYNRAALDESVDFYLGDYQQPGALRAGLGAYRAFEQDKEENLAWLAANGKCKVPALGFSGARSMHAVDGYPMLSQVYENVEVKNMDEVGHYLAEEDPEQYVKILVWWAGKHPGEKF
ncbi:Soluble epoxide hydrolase [Lasiodiplodia theobromae]|uniref:Soluble epoxide hydrolase n=1 Tax=Lasiodiplodia theobromae TaxID=45133 RepID=A0A5N5DFJ5_9PEZI|nr:Soluble epoxide hydrolase [Lasiodiplodia theobromae]